MDFLEKIYDVFEVLGDIVCGILDIIINLLPVFLVLIVVLLVIKYDIDTEAAYDSQAEALVINVELDGGRYPDRLVSFEFEVDGVMYRDIVEVEPTEYYAVGDVFTIEYQSKDITKTRIMKEGKFNEEKN